MTAPELARFEAFVEQIPFSTCWHWLGYTKHNGYGKFRVSGKQHQVHRVAYEHFVGKIPDGLTIDHLCRNTACVNPKHLEPVTVVENLRRNPNSIDKQHAAKLVCKYGHGFSTENTYFGNGSRHCRKCRNRRNAAYKAKLKLRN